MTACVISVDGDVQLAAPTRVDVWAEWCSASIHSHHTLNGLSAQRTRLAHANLLAAVHAHAAVQRGSMLQEGKRHASKKCKLSEQSWLSACHARWEHPHHLRTQEGLETMELCSRTLTK
jgi:hypothetical protein